MKIQDISHKNFTGTILRKLDNISLVVFGSLGLIILIIMNNV